MARTVSKNAKVSRGADTCDVLQYKGKKVKVCPVLFVNGNGKYMAVQDETSKVLLLDDSGKPIAWKTAKIEKEKNSQ